MELALTPAKKSFVKFVSPLIGATLFVLALWFLKRQLANYSLADVSAQLKLIPLSRLGLAFAFTALNYFSLTLFDYLGSLYVKAEIPYRKVALASFVSYSISQNVGFTALTGTPFRLRVYGASGVPPLKTALIVAFCGFTFWLGFLIFGGALFLGQPGFLAGLFSFSPVILRIFGGSFLALVAAYLFFSWRGPVSMRVFKWRFTLPRFGIAAAQVACAFLDWLSVGTVLYFLFPEQLPFTYAAFLGVFLLAQTGVFTSQVPGGIGVFESVFIGCLSPAVPAATVLSSLIAFRAIYYLLPFALSVAIIGFCETAGRRKKRRHGGNLNEPNAGG